MAAPRYARSVSRLALASFLGAALVLLVVPSPALACTLACRATFAPTGTIAAPAHLPANGAYVAMVAGSAPQLTIVRTRAGVTTTTTVDTVGGLAGVALLPDAQAGDHFQVSAELTCGGGPVSNRATTEVEITDVVPLPTELGVVEVDVSRTLPVAVWDDRGGCTSDLRSAVATYTLALDPALDPWRDALVLTPMLDEHAWYGASDGRIGPSFVYAPCDAPLPSQTDPGGTTPGRHTLRIQGALRGLDTTITTDTAELELTCAATGGGNGGCSTASTPRPSGAPLTFGTVIALVLVTRARRPRSSGTRAAP